MNFDEWFLSNGIPLDTDFNVAKRAFEAGAQSQQAKIDELQKLRSLDEMAINQLAQANQVWQIKCDELQRKIVFQEKAIKNIKLQFENKQIDCDRSDHKIDELQERVDEALYAADESCGVSVAAFVKLNRILKGNKDEN